MNKCKLMVAIAILTRPPTINQENLAMWNFDEIQTLDVVGDTAAIMGARYFA